MIYCYRKEVGGIAKFGRVTSDISPKPVCVAVKFYHTLATKLLLEMLTVEAIGIDTSMAKS